MVAKEWVLVAARLPALPGQAQVASALEPAGKDAEDRSPLRRPLLVARVPVKNQQNAKGIAFQVRYRATLMARELVPRRAGVPVVPAAPLAPQEREAYLAATDYMNWRSDEFQEWLDGARLRRGPGEGEVDFARRAFQFVRGHFSYFFAPDLDRHASAVCKAGRSDCAGLSLLYAAALRANRVPARVLYGRWARPGAPDGGSPSQTHAKPEFYAEGVGWVPADPSSAVESDRTPDGLLYFGRDPGDFIAFHVDHNLVVDAGRLGKLTLGALQVPETRVIGDGTDRGWRYNETWKVRNTP
jgi:transglutaminase-like putative cysteine protease